MISTRQKKAEQLSIEIWWALDELNHLPDATAITALIFTTPELLQARLRMKNKAAEIALDHYKAVCQFITATGWKPPPKPKPFRFDN